MEKDDIRLKNLKPFPKGKSGNPKGKKKGTKSMKKVYKELYEMKIDLKNPFDKNEILKNIPLQKAIAIRKFFNAVYSKNSETASENIINRIDGKPTDVKNITVKGKKKNPITTIDYSKLTPEQLEKLFNEKHNEIINDE